MKRCRPSCLGVSPSGLALVLTLHLIPGNARGQAPGMVVRLDPALDAIVSTNARVETLKEDYFGIPEGPLWVQEGTSGYLVFSDIGANTIYKWTPDGTLSVLLERAGYSGPDIASVGNISNNGRLNIATSGPNGIARDPQGRLVFSAMGDRAIIRVERDGRRTVLADRYEGKRLNSTNDVVVRSDGAVYFTDPTSGLRGGIKSPEKELNFHGVFLLKDGRLQVIDRDPQGSAPNGVALSQDEKHLYVNGGQKITRYDVRPDGTVANPRLFIDMSSDTAPGNTDGMKVDLSGNVYCTGPGGIWIMSPAGKHLGTIRVPERATNLAFGDPDGKGLYITGRRSIFRVRVLTPGIRPQPASR